MKNFIDKLFFELIDEFKNKSEEEIYDNIFLKYQLVPQTTKTSLEKFLKDYPYWGYLDSKNINFEIFKKKAYVFKHNHKDFVWLYNKLKDEKSKFIFFAILNNFYNFDFLNLDKARERIYKQYFDLDLIRYCSKEVFVDVGSYYGETTLDFINTYGEDSYKSIYCYEITKNMLEYSKTYLSKFKNVHYKNFAVSNSNKSLFFDENDASSSANHISKNGKSKVKATSLDNNIKEKITMIKMDIEGGERKALIGAKEHIKNDLPKLLISVYHNNTDLFKLPKLINKITNRYDFYLRYYGGNIYATEIVLFCIPRK